MSAAEIIAELPHLNSQELARVEAKLRELIATTHAAPTEETPVNLPRIHSPRLAHPEQSKDFTKQVVELSTDARL